MFKIFNKNKKQIDNTMPSYRYPEPKKKHIQELFNVLEDIEKYDKTGCDDTRNALIKVMESKLNDLWLRSHKEEDYTIDSNPTVSPPPPTPPPSRTIKGTNTKSE